MSTDILPKSSTPLSTSTRHKRSQSTAATAHEPRVAPLPQDDPAMLVGLVLAYGRQGQGDVKAIPSLLLERLHDQARSGDPSCTLVLDYLGRKVHRGRPAVSHYQVPTEIVSADPAIKEDR